MSVLTTLQQRAKPRFASTPRGWIGIDIGSRSIKLAQVQRSGDRYQICQRWCVRREQPPQHDHDTRPINLADKHLRLAELRGLFTRSECAAVVSMSYHSLRSLELPAASHDETRDMVCEELAADDDIGETDYVFDFWSTNEAADQASNVTALRMPATLAMGVAEDLTSAGYECQVLDGLPCALARAVTMIHGISATPIVALDLGDSEFTFVLVVNGQPIYTRPLRGGGLRTLMQPVQQALNLTHDQAMQLLIRYAVTPPDQAERTLVSGPAQMLEQPVAKLINELKRTLQYAVQQFGVRSPSELVLLGGGASIRHLPEGLSKQLGIPTSTWCLPTSQPHEAADDAQFGVAAALSALRWEQRSCS
ncbi:type IV pilus assembly protein PilM [Rhodopirellula maiorica SM1]|uniref:Type IV pilus assembly protein PilM n=1 Tax=Rhodopirellula maiorica SM1 TaxID=1265738 RepID=M5RQA0_9BACT|nr:pilus assembly protein PilM [Rhodopirellula maiorica]EMI21470.1 type IV pilus assembly protein PilM [Rhodopirellula maiorica SM1]